MALLVNQRGERCFVYFKMVLQYSFYKGLSISSGLLIGLLLQLEKIQYRKTIFLIELKMSSEVSLNLVTM